MGFWSSLGEAVKDMKFEGEMNDRALQKQAECERDAKIYEEKQSTIRTFAWLGFWSVVFVILFITWLLIRVH